MLACAGGTVSGATFFGHAGGTGPAEWAPGPSGATFFGCAGGTRPSEWRE
jgi:hypothetical protein